MEGSDTVEVLTAAQAAQHMRCAVKTIEEHARSGNLPGLLWGDGGWVFPAAAFYARVNQLAIEQAEKRRQSAKPLAAAGSGGKKDEKKAPPPTPPSLDARPGPRLGWRRSEAPLRGKTNP